MTHATPYHVFIQTSADAPTRLHPLTEDPADFVVTTDYDIIGWYPEDGEALLGHFSVDEFKLGAALNADVSWFDIMDCESQDHHDIFCLMFDPETGNQTPEFQAALGDVCDGFDIAYIPTDDLLDLPAGPHALRTFVQHTSCAYVVVGVTGLTSVSSLAELTLASARAAKLEAMGFHRYKHSPFFFLNAACVLRALPHYLEFDAQDVAQA